MTPKAISSSLRLINSEQKERVFPDLSAVVYETNNDTKLHGIGAGIKLRLDAAILPVGFLGLPP